MNSIVARDVVRRIPVRIAAILIAILGLTGVSRAGEPNWPERVTIGTASAGGTYYAYGDGLARLLTRKLDVPFIMRPTEGPAENLKLVLRNLIPP